MLIFQFPKTRKALFLLLAKLRKNHSSKFLVLSGRAAKSLFLWSNTLGSHLLSLLWGGVGKGKREDSLSRGNQTSGMPTLLTQGCNCRQTDRHDLVLISLAWVQIAMKKAAAKAPVRVARACWSLFCCRVTAFCTQASSRMPKYAAVTPPRPTTEYLLPSLLPIPDDH